MQSITQLGKKHFAAFLLPPPLSSGTEHRDQGQILEGTGQMCLELSSLQSCRVKLRAGSDPCPSLYNCFCKCFQSTQPSCQAESPPTRGNVMFF